MLPQTLSVVMIRLRNSVATVADRRGLRALLRRKRALLLVLAMAVSVVPLHAQKTRYTPNFGAAGKPSMSVVHDSSFASSPPVEEESCFPWKLSAVRPATVSVARLKVPSKARSEYDKACDASNKNKFDEAEQHARSAIDLFRDYSAAWVMLGVILEEQHRSREARDACSHVATIDASYLPSYFCAAEVSVRGREWEQVMSSAEGALGVQPEGNPYPYYYLATAYFHTNHLAEAKKSALQAAEMDTKHDEPLINFLLARIYEREGDNPNAVVQLQQFLKHPTDRRQEDVAKHVLAKLESQQSTK